MNDFFYRFVAGDSELTLLLLHGTGGDEEDLLGVGRAIAPKANLLSPRGRSLEEGRPRFFRRFGEGQFDERDVIFRAGELAGFIEDAIREYGLDPQQLFALGYSNGANIAAAVMLLHPQALAGGMLLRAMVPLEPKSPPDLSGKPILMREAKNDAIVPVENAEKLAQMFKSAGADVTLTWSDFGHGLMTDDLQACAEWLNQTTSSPPARRA